MAQLNRGRKWRRIAGKMRAQVSDFGLLKCKHLDQSSVQSTVVSSYAHAAYSSRILEPSVRGYLSLLLSLSFSRLHPIAGIAQQGCSDMNPNERWMEINQTLRIISIFHRHTTWFADKRPRLVSNQIIIRGPGLVPSPRIAHQ